ncbi:hypothetical protein J1N35_025802 [Gossypium stocksii]|uniref:Uncharacterized protein n=1 Tax=Gossypium stocksii TaxID=47602 RepID=A0A9D3ZY69_9ROSI|nr:hypothetical protein J1N35_025802 [Gossypium stocksii]
MSNIEPENLQEILEELTVLGSKCFVSTQGIHTCRREYLTPLAKNCATRRSGPAYFPFTITILCLKAEIHANVKKTGYNQGTITDWDLYRIAGDSILQQQDEKNEDPEEEEDDPTENEPVQEAEIPNETEPMEPEVEPEFETSMFGAPPPSSDVRDELSKLMDLMQHMQWQQQAYWRYSKLRDDSMRSTLKKIYNNPFIFVPEFPDFIFEPWSSLSKKEQSDSCQGNNDGAKDESISEGSANK